MHLGVLHGIWHFCRAHTTKKVFLVGVWTSYSAVSKYSWVLRNCKIWASNSNYKYVFASWLVNLTHDPMLQISVILEHLKKTCLYGKTKGTPPILVHSVEPDRDQNWNQKPNTSVRFCLSYITFRTHPKPPLFEKLLRGRHFRSVKNTKNTQNAKL